MDRETILPFRPRSCTLGLMDNRVTLISARISLPSPLEGKLPPQAGAQGVLQVLDDLLNNYYKLELNPIHAKCTPKASYILAPKGRHLPDSPDIPEIIPVNPRFKSLFTLKLHSIAHAISAYKNLRPQGATFPTPPKRTPRIPIIPDTKVKKMEFPHE